MEPVHSGNKQPYSFPAGFDNFSQFSEMFLLGSIFVGLLSSHGVRSICEKRNWSNNRVSNIELGTFAVCVLAGIAFIINEYIKMRKFDE